jgi:hypothetical protein
MALALPAFSPSTASLVFSIASNNTIYL